MTTASLGGAPDKWSSGLALQLCRSPHKAMPSHASGYRWDGSVGQELRCVSGCIRPIVAKMSPDMAESEGVTRSPLKRGAELLSLAAVIGLLALLVWRVVNQDPSKIPQQIAKGEHPDAPNFELPRLDTDGTFALSSLRGKAVVINFWAEWCEPCRREVPALERAWRRWRVRGLVVVGIDYDDLSGDAQRFMRRYGMTYPAVHDRRKTTVAAYGVVAVPETYFVDRWGRLVGQHIVGPVSSTQLSHGIREAMHASPRPS